MLPNSTFPEFAYRSQKNYHRGFPWFGDDCNLGISPNKQFDVTFKVYMLPIKDLSRSETSAYTDFDEYVNVFKNTHHIGDAVNAIAMDGKYNTSIDGESEATSIFGRIIKIEIDYTNNRIRVFLVHGDESKISEVYPDTLFNEDYVQESLSMFFRTIKLKNYKKINEKRN